MCWKMTTRDWENCRRRRAWDFLRGRRRKQIQGITRSEEWRRTKSKARSKTPPFAEGAQDGAPAKAQGKAKNPKAKNPKAKNPKSKNPKAKNPKAKNPKAKNPKAKNPKAKNPKAKNP